MHSSHVPAAVAPGTDTSHFLRQCLERGTVLAKRMPQLMWLDSTRPRVLDCRELDLAVLERSFAREIELVRVVARSRGMRLVLATHPTRAAR